MKLHDNRVKRRENLISESIYKILDKTINEIHESNGKDPLDGDEVHQIARAFTKKLCEFNAEEDQYNQIIRRWPKEKELKHEKERTRGSTPS